MSLFQTDSLTFIFIVGQPFVKRFPYAIGWMVVLWYRLTRVVLDKGP